MSFQRWGYTFEGAWTDAENLRNQGGVYVIWCKSGENWSVLDVGESGEVKDRAMNHGRRDCWTRHCRGTIYYSATYTLGLTQDQRRQIERQIRQQENPPCGEV
jgi:hypothetical protein